MHLHTHTLHFQGADLSAHPQEVADAIAALRTELQAIKAEQEQAWKLPEQQACVPLKACLQVQIQRDRAACACLHVCVSSRRLCLSRRAYLQPVTQEGTVSGCAGALDAEQQSASCLIELVTFNHALRRL